MIEQPYEAEDVLQRLLADYPNLLAGDQDDQPRRWLLVQRELGIGDAEGSPDRWAIDHLFLDQDGVPTLVEVKRSSDTRLRREVVGQLLDYAANASAFWGVEKLRAAFEARHPDAADAAASLAALVGEDEDPDQFWGTVAVNLSAGQAPTDLRRGRDPTGAAADRRVLNEQMSRTEVLALEVRQYVEQGGTRVTLVPRLIGETQPALQAKGSSGRARNRWTEADVLAAIRKRYPPDVAQRLVELYEFMRERGARQSFGTGATPSVTIWLGERPDPATSNPVAVAFFADRFAVPFNYIRGKRSEAELKRLADLVRQIPGAAPDVDRFEEKDFRALGYLEAEVVLTSDDALAAFTQAIVEASKPPAPAATS